MHGSGPIRHLGHRADGDAVRAQVGLGLGHGVFARWKIEAASTASAPPMVAPSTR